MARKAKIEKSKQKPKFSTRVVHRCFKCGRERGVLRKFGLCRICFREMAHNAEIPGIRKSN
jgi:small subunit ribosomal protein S14